MRTPCSTACSVREIRVFESHDTRTGAALHALHDGADAEDPWIACLLGCVSLSRSVSRGLRESRPSDLPPADTSDPALAWLLGVAALCQRFDAHLAAVEPATPERGAAAPTSRRGLLR